MKGSHFTSLLSPSDKSLCSCIRMTEIELEAVVEFLRNNGLSECESALMEDVIEKSEVGSSLLQKFYFPMAMAPPLIRIPAAWGLHSMQEVAGSKGSSDDEFMSLGSSTTELCASEFTNPYGIRTTCPASQASSDRMSQFGTARDYRDFDMQNDLYWYKERDEDYAMPPLFVGRDFDGDPSEDKYVMTEEAGEIIEDHLVYNYLPDGSNKDFERHWPLTSRKKLKDQAYKDYYEPGEDFPLEKSDEKLEEHHNEYSCSAPLCACCNDSSMVYQGKSVEYELGTHGGIEANSDQLRKTDSNLLIEWNCTDDWNGGVNNTIDLHPSDEDCRTNEKDDSDFIYSNVNGGELHEPEVKVNGDGGDVSGELLLYETNEDDYEIFDLRIIHRKDRTGFEENKEFPVVINSIIAGRYYVTEFLGSAAFSKVVQAHDLHLGMDVCLKIIKNDKDFFDQSLDEIKLLKYVNKHDPVDERHILRLYDYFYFQEHLFIVTELLRANLYEFQKFNKESGEEPYFTMHRIQAIARQCLEALTYLHDLGIIHCDLKPENILIKSYTRCEVKIIDLGSSCFETDNLSLYVQSRSYRAPEVILGLPYDPKIDLWSVGCILAELCSGEVLFPNESVVTILARMIGILGPIDMDMLQKGQETHKYFTEDYDLYYINEGTSELKYIAPDASSLEHYLQISDPGFISFLNYLLETNPSRRPTAKEALQHPWLDYPYKVYFAGK